MSKKLQLIEEGTQLIDNSFPSRWMTAERVTETDYKHVIDDDGIVKLEFSEVEDYYLLRAGNEFMPADWTKRFETLEAMRQEMGDLRHWVVNQYND